MQTGGVYAVRLAKPNDYEAYYGIRAEESNLFWTGYEKAPDYEGFRGWYLGRLDDSDRLLYLMFKSIKGECMGSLNIDWNREKRLVAIGYSIKSEFENKGLGTYLVKQALELIEEQIKENKSYQNATEVIAWINEHNKASQRVADKCGFKQSDGSELRIRFGKQERYYRYRYGLLDS